MIALTALSIIFNCFKQDIYALYILEQYIYIYKAISFKNLIIRKKTIQHQTKLAYF